jgi:hypothetical protein
MTKLQGNLALLQDPVAQQLLASQQLARLPYTWTDGTPRVVPIWFHWNGRAVVLGTPTRAPKLRALTRNPSVSVTIDDSTSWPYKALLLRGQSSVEMLDDVSPEYEASAHRYFGATQGEAWLSQLRGVPMARISIEARLGSRAGFRHPFPERVVSLTVARAPPVIFLPGARSAA